MSPAPADGPAVVTVTFLDSEQATAAAIDEARAAVRSHGRLARALIDGLAAEGRAFARTDEGAALRGRLLASPAMTRLAALWQALGLPLPDEASATRPGSRRAGQLIGLLRASLDGSAGGGIDPGASRRAPPGEPAP